MLPAHLLLQNVVDLASVTANADPSLWINGWYGYAFERTQEHIVGHFRDTEVGGGAPCHCLPPAHCMPCAQHRAATAPRGALTG